VKILIVTPFPAIPGASGGATVVFNLIERLAQHHEVIYLTFAREEDVPQVAKLAPYCIDVITVPFPGGDNISPFAKASYLLRRVAQNILSFLTLTPVFVWKCKSRFMERALRQAISLHNPDVVHVCFSQMAYYVAECGGVPAVMDTLDVPLVSAYRKVRMAVNPLAKIYHFLQWLFWIRYETRYYPRFGKVLTVTQQDAAALRVFCPELDIYADAVGVDIPPALPVMAGARGKIGFLASFGHAPNVDAVLFFLREIFPLIRMIVPGVEFVVAGKNPPSILMEAAGEGVRFVGFVEDVAQFYAGVDVVVAPLRLGGGIKIKVLEAMACGRPVVATSVGAEGIASLEDEALLVADEPGRFASCVCRLLNDPDLGKSLGERGRELVSQRFSWQRVTEDLARIYAELIRGLQ
jgi:glycosyltransferase involved in cell wall biosynthesis